MKLNDIAKNIISGFGIYRDTYSLFCVMYIGMETKQQKKIRHVYNDQRMQNNPNRYDTYTLVKYVFSAYITRYNISCYWHNALKILYVCVFLLVL